MNIVPVEKQEGYIKEQETEITNFIKLLGYFNELTEDERYSLYDFIYTEFRYKKIKDFTDTDFMTIKDYITR
jgi:hypothetical protein